MRVLFCGDVFGKSGRKMVAEFLPKLKEKLSIDIVVVNGENAAHGLGLTPKTYQEIVAAGADVVTLGNHSFDKKEVIPLLETESCLVRPLNYPENTVGSGYCIKELPNGKRLAVVQLLGKVFMRPVDNPFKSIRTWLAEHPKGGEYDYLLVDMHAEATAEKNGMGYFLDGIAAAVLGTHTHIPTADARILPNGTAFMTDVGMCGDYDSIIGMKVSGPLSKMVEEGKAERFAPAESAGTFCAVVVDIDEQTGRAVEIFPVRIGAWLENTHEV